MSEESYEMFEPLDIDNGELDHVSKQSAFVLGYELAQLSAEFAAGQHVEKPVHTENVDRIRKAAAKRGRSVSLEIMNDDWYWLVTTDSTEDSASG